jgi:hypothetical protein
MAKKKASKKKAKEVNYKVPRWKNIPENIEDYLGFVYMVIHKPTGQYYVGQKKFWFKDTKPPLKGRKNKRHSLVESDWKTYWGSSNKLKEWIAKEGTSEFERRIIRPCKTQWEMSYTELEWQMKLDVLRDDKALNGIINVRLGKKGAVPTDD